MRLTNIEDCFPKTDESEKQLFLQRKPKCVRVTLEQHVLSRGLGGSLRVCGGGVCGGVGGETKWGRDVTLPPEEGPVAAENFQTAPCGLKFSDLLSEINLTESKHERTG